VIAVLTSTTTKNQQTMTASHRRYHLADFSEIEGVPCPCGTARRAFKDVEAFPGTLHVTEISEDARKHYHKTLTETYYFLECGPDAMMELDDEIIPVRPGISIVIPPGVKHRALGKMKVLIVAIPNFDPADEWFD
jgi:mannose-6-phosphate isomerase-like protein (cupin superfamily)